MVQKNNVSIIQLFKQNGFHTFEDHFFTGFLKTVESYQISSTQNLKKPKNINHFCVYQIFYDSGKFILLLWYNNIVVQTVLSTDNYKFV